MTRIHHPTLDQIHLAGIFDALSDPTRLEILVRLEALGEAACTEFLDLSSKTNLSYHFARLREAGITRTRQGGTQRFVSLRKRDLEQRFPGLIDHILRIARAPGVVGAIAEQDLPEKRVRRARRSA